MQEAKDKRKKQETVHGWKAGSYNGTGAYAQVLVYVTENRIVDRND
jgi:hypothetical protein